MKITLISVYESNVALGMRIMSALLKRAGYATRMIFLPRETEGFRHVGFQYAYADSVLDQVAKLAGDSDLIGISLMSNYFDNAVQVTQHLRRSTRAPIIWGGIHPTVRPEECLRHADIVCVGEGEDALLELVQRMSDGKGYVGIDNLWYKRNGDIVRTPIRPLPFDLDRFPYPDYDLDEEYALYKGAIRRVTDKLLLYYLCWPYTSDSEPTYVTMLSRGCSCSCTYCCNNAYREIYGKQWRIRRRSVANFIGELKAITTRFPEIKWIRIDDDLFVEDVALVREFTEVYKPTLHLPLFVTGFHSSMVHEEVVRLLVEAGMRRARIGIQTGSTQTLHKVYKRPGSLEKVKQTLQIFHKHSDRLELPVYDLIIDNPWESDEEKLKTLHLLLDMPKPYMLNLFSLTFFPGTELHKRAKREGILRDEHSDVYGKYYLEEERKTYINGLFRLFQYGDAPRWLMAWLLMDRMRRLNWVWLPYLINRVISAMRLAGAGWRALRRGDLLAFWRALRARMRRRLLVPKWA